MSEVQSEFIKIEQLQIGMFIELEMGWLSHPFPKGSFKITSAKQIAVIHGLGLTRVRYFPSKSDLPTESMLPAELDFVSGSDVGGDAEAARKEAAAEVLRLRQQKSNFLSAQQRSLADCERRFGAALREHKLIVTQLDSRPHEAMLQSLTLVNSFVGDLQGEGESAIRLLSEGMGDKASMHPINVTIISLLLGRAMALPQVDMVDLGMAALLHDVGKSQLPDRVRWLEDNFSSAENRLYQEHVSLGVALGQRMKLTPGALQAIAQHHEMIDGSGFPAHLKGLSFSLPSKILALVNRYDSLCNPSRPATAMTPHEALSLIFAQLRTRFDGVVLNAFIRMMGVYPPGSVVQLVDDRYALVVSINSSRPLKPRVIVHDPSVSKHEALILDLENFPELGIRRSLKPVSLPKAAMDYLSPRQRICYFFERAIDPTLTEVSR